MPKKKMHPNSIAAARKNKAPNWVKGQSGNLSGPPVGYKKRATILCELLELLAKDKNGNLIKNPINPDEDKVTYEKLINVALIQKAIAGNIEAIKEIQDTIYGKITDKKELTGVDGNPLQVMIIDDIK